jgi:hypothetical protein
MTDADIADAARVWNALRLQAKALKAEYQQITCTQDPNYFTPCWRMYVEWADQDDLRLLPRAEWCDACRHRSELHQQYVATVRKRAGALVRLQHTMDLRDNPRVRP